MSLSRMETKQREQQHRTGNKRKRRRLLLLNTTLLAIIIIVVAVFYRGDQLLSTAKEQISKLSMFKETTKYSAADNAGTNNAEVKPNDSLADGNEANDEGTIVIEDDPVIDNTPIEATPIIEQDELTPVEIASSTVNLAFVGDILQGEYINGWLQQEGYSYPFQKALLHLSSADITSGNLEMPITTRGTPQEKTHVFKGAPEGLQGLVDAGIDIVSLANNHTLDQGVEGMLDTITHLDEYGIKHTGAGNNDTEAYTPVIQEINGIKVAYLSISHVLPVTTWKANKYTAGVAEAYDLTRAMQAIEETEELADVTILMIHWGEERKNKPTEAHLQMARQLIDAGVDIIVGSHPHVLQGFEQYNGKWIAYSLGNFVFASHPKGKQAETGVLNATCNINAECELEFYPMKIVNAQPTPVEDEEAEEILQFLQDVSFGGVTIDKRGKLSVK